ncbi:MAG: cobalamin biosynthesis protein CbiN [Methanosphaera stadtmanae]|nr:cobalamin biosynthesis protein CbiN [Methanosphaera stadtmanae]
MENKTVYVGIFIVALIVCILSPFLASGDPDGLEASAEHINPKALEAPQALNVSMPDYTLEGMEDNPLVGVACLIIGLIISLVACYGVFYLITKRNN